MKKMLAVLLMLAMAMGVFAGCGKKETSGEDGGAETKKESGQEEQTATEDDKKEDGAGVDYSVAMVVAGALGDKGFNDNAKKGLDSAEEAFGIKTQVVELSTADKTKYEPTLLDLADSGKYDVIMVAGNAMREVLEKVAVDYPEQKFYLYDASVNYDNGDFPNVYCNTFLQNEASFLAGVVAASMTSSDLPDANEDKIVGNVILMDMAVMNDFMVGYIEGCQYADPEVRVNTAYVGASDAAKAKDMAISMYQQKADIVFQVAASSGLGVIEAGKESGKYVIGVDQDQAMVLMDGDPEAAKRILTSVLKRTDVAVYRALDMMINDPDSVPWGTCEALGMEEECVGIAKSDVYQELVSEEVKAAVEEAESKIISGEIKVGSAYGMETEEIAKLRDSVKP